MTGGRYAGTGTIGFATTVGLGTGGLKRTGGGFEMTGLIATGAGLTTTGWATAGAVRGFAAAGFDKDGTVGFGRASTVAGTIAADFG